MNAPDFYTPAELADLLRLPHRTVEAWRYRNTGPRFYKVGGAIRYSRSDVDTFLKASRQ